MENNLQESPKLSLAADNSDAKYIARLSTLLVATIEEAKDRICQIEYVFCSQLYPKVKVNYQSFQKIHSKAREAAESAYNEKEKDLLLQIENLQREKDQLLDENQLLRSEKEKYIRMEKQLWSNLQELQEDLKLKDMDMKEVWYVHLNLEKKMKELEEKNCILTKMQTKLEVETGELQLELRKKSMEVDEEKERVRKLLQKNESHASLMAQKEIQLREYEEKTNGLASQLRNTEGRVHELLSVLRNKSEEVCRVKELQEKLQKEIEVKAKEITVFGGLLHKSENENKLLAAKVETLLSLVDELERELGNKPVELQETRNVQQKLSRQHDSLCCERTKRELGLDKFEEERKQLLEKQNSLMKKIDELHHCLSERTREFTRQIEAKDSELQNEKSKNGDHIAAYKSLKSQHNFLLKKSKLTEENMLSAPLDKMENESEETENNTSKALGVVGEETTPLDEEVETSDDKKKIISIQRSSPVSPSPLKSTSSAKPCPPAGIKRPISYWRDTRSNQSRVGPDPHDDFLDTPLENVRENRGKIVKEDLSESSPTSMKLNNSDEKTQDMNVDAVAGPQKLCMSPPKASSSGFKYVEPVRKKSERENLKGVECNQCKKFYDAVLPGVASYKKNLRCEHHDGVSRHRYRYAPPMTPEGFWNIGFESEM